MTRQDSATSASSGLSRADGVALAAEFSAALGGASKPPKRQMRETAANRWDGLPDPLLHFFGHGDRSSAELEQEVRLRVLLADLAHSLCSMRVLG